MLCQQAAHARPKPTSLQIRTNVNLYNMHSRPNWSSALTRFFWALAYQFFCPFVVCEASVTLDADWIVQCSICSCPVLRLLSPLPLGGGGVHNKEHQKKKKKGTKWGEMSALSDPLRYLGASMSVLRAHPFSSWSRTHSYAAKKKKGGVGWPHMRVTFATPPSMATAVPTATS